MIKNTPILSWITKDSGYSEARIAEGETLRIIPVKDFLLELWFYKQGEQPRYLNSYVGLDEARAAARTWIGDDE